MHLQGVKSKENEHFHSFKIATWLYLTMVLICCLLELSQYLMKNKIKRKERRTEATAQVNVKLWNALTTQRSNVSYQPIIVLESRNLKIMITNWNASFHYSFNISFPCCADSWDCLILCTFDQIVWSSTSAPC